MSEQPRSRQARDLAEAALVRLVSAYGAIPEFVLLGGLVPDFLCSGASFSHVGTTDVDVQVNLEIQGGSANARHPERALQAAGFKPDSAHLALAGRAGARPGREGGVPRRPGRRPGPEQCEIEDCDNLGAVNLRGTGFAARAWTLTRVTAAIDGRSVTVVLRVARLEGYLLAKIHAARGRRLQKYWYDIAYVLLHNDAGGPRPAGVLVRKHFSADLAGPAGTALKDLAANFADDAAQGSTAYADVMRGLYPDVDPDIMANDSVAAVAEFISSLTI
jgi:hypothetical protein